MEYHNADNGIIIRLDVDDNLKQCLRTVIEQEGITAAAISGVGALKEFTLGYFQPEVGEYTKTTFSDSHELTNATGVVSCQDGEPHIHLHATLAGPDHQAIGGHLHEGRIAAAGEFFLTPFDTRIQRRHDESLNLDLMTFQDG
jgi:predicted DNA-binding protein with PD1-like motif